MDLVAVAPDTVVGDIDAVSALHRAIDSFRETDGDPDVAAAQQLLA